MNYRIAALCVALLLSNPAMAASVEAASAAVAEIDPSSVPLPELRFTETDEDREGYDKYFYFVREDTDFAAAYRDIRECDALARGVRFHVGGAAAPYPYTYTMAGAIGGAIGNVMVDAIFGSAQRRQMRRTNLRTCMGYKGYSRHGLQKNLWSQFNFEEGNRAVPEEERQKYLQMQAKAAIAGRPVSQELEF